MKKIFKNLNIPKNFACEICADGKLARSPFEKNGTRANGLLETIHSDVCGPMSVKSIGGSKFYVTFIDDFSRKTFVYIIKSKDQVFECFKKFKALVENQTNKKIKIFRSDGGGEYDNKNFSDLFDNEGILHQQTAPYTPEQNGLAERMNRTIVEKVRCMLSGANLTKGYWAEAVKYAVEVINVLPNASDRDKSPDEIWTGSQPNLAKFKIFGCKAMAHVPSQKRVKLDMKAVKCIFIGFPENTKAFKLFNQSTKKVIISRDVVFFEEKTSGNSLGVKNDVNTNEYDFFEFPVTFPTERRG